MNPSELQKIKQFLRDKAMCDAVYKAIQDEFLSDKLSNDIQVLAASRLSISLLKTAFQRMERYKKDEKEEREKPEIRHV